VSARQHQPITAYVAVGANLGDRRANIERAVQILNETDGVEVTRVSSLLENQAVGGPPGAPDFLNGAIELRTTLSPRDLLDRLLNIEQALGRQRREKWGPRTIDLDLLLYGDDVIDQPHLHVPHPRLHERRFVLQPLAEIAPDVVHPTIRKSITRLLSELSR
jgi:2-amino-4-hydroxy-6-hydroxymethyldihydropteridine diphosphokinase